RFDSHQQVTPARLGLGDFDVDEAFRMIDRQVLVEADGFHGFLASALASPRRDSASKTLRELLQPREILFPPRRGLYRPPRGRARPRRGLHQPWRNLHPPRSEEHTSEL